MLLAAVGCYWYLAVVGSCYLALVARLDSGSATALIAPDTAATVDDTVAIVAGLVAIHKLVAAALTF